MKLFNTPLKITLLLIITWIIFANLHFGIQLTHTIIPLFIIAILALTTRPLWKNLKKFPKITQLPTKKWFYPTIIALILLTGIIARLTFLQFDYDPRWDPGTFYWNAESLANTGELIPDTDSDTAISHQAYFAMYPYEMNYTGLLALANLAFGGGLPSVILLNLLLDLLGTLLIFRIVKNLTRKKWPPLAAAALYFLNPFNIVFSALSLPLIAVNTLILLVIYLVVKFIRHHQTLKAPQLITLFAALGLILGFANGFRPIFTIILIAILLLILYLFLTKTITKKPQIIKTITATLLMLISYFTATQLNFLITDHYAHQTAARNPSGWALYVGSNISTHGKWTIDSPDLRIRDQLWQQYPNKQDVHNQLTRLALERYQQNGFQGNLDLLINKLLIAAGDQSSSMYNTSALQGYSGPPKDITKELAEIFILALAAYLAFHIFKNWHRLDPATRIFLALTILGFFAGSLLVEVKNRYFTIFLPLMIILATYLPTTMRRKSK